MSRTLTAAVATAAADPRLRAALLAHFAFASGDVRLWTGIGDLVWSGDTYSGIGTFGGVDRIEETAAVRAAGIVFELSGVPSALLATALTEHYQGRACSLWLALFDSDHVLIADPVLMFSGRMDQMAIEDGAETAVIRLSAESRLADLERPPEIAYYTDADQRALHPGDRGLEFVAAMQEKVLFWGRTRVPIRAGAPAGGGTAGAAGSNFGSTIGVGEEQGSATAVTASTGFGEESGSAAAQTTTSGLSQDQLP